jgi:hypothetical protein
MYNLVTPFRNWWNGEEHSVPIEHQRDPRLKYGRVWRQRQPQEVHQGLIDLKLFSSSVNVIKFAGMFVTSFRAGSFLPFQLQPRNKHCSLCYHWKERKKFYDINARRASATKASGSTMSPMLILVRYSAWFPTGRWLHFQQDAHMSDKQ